MKTIIRIFAVALCICMMASLMGAYVFAAESNPTVAGAYVIRGNELIASLKLSNNKGLNTLVMSLAYNSEALTLKSIENGTVFSEENNASLFEVNTAKNPLILYFEENGLANVTANGVLVTLTFDIVDSEADFGLEAKVDSDNTFACASDSIMPVDVTVDVKTVRLQIPGDLNNDGNINAIDSNMLIKLLTGTAPEDICQELCADINGDGNINAIDSNFMKKLLLG